MAVITHEDVTPPIVANTIMQKRFIDGVFKVYTIAPIEGYVLHDKAYDTPILDPETLEETGEVILGYRTSMGTCAASYDFVANPREFYAVPETDVPADQIFGNTGGNHEIM